MTRRGYIGVGGAIGLGLFVAVGVLVNTGQFVPGAGGGGGGPITVSSISAGAPCTDPAQELVWNGTAYQCNEPDNPSLVMTLKDEFMAGATNCTTGGLFFTGAATGTSACGYNNADALHPGLLSLTTDAVATDGIRMATQANSVVFGSVPRCVTWLWKIHNLSTSVDQYVDRVGYAEPTANTDSVDAVEATYDFANNGGVHKWALTTSANSVRTTALCTGSTGDISADTWYKLKVCVNAAASSATLTVNDVLCQTNTTNIPTGTSRGTAIGLQHFNAAGSVPAAQLSFVDFVKEVAPFPVAR